MKISPLLVILPLVMATPAFAGILMFPKNLTPQRYLSNCQSVNGSASQTGPRALLCDAERFAVTCTFTEHTVCADVENAPARLFFFFEESQALRTFLTGESGGGGSGGSGNNSGGGNGGGGGGLSCIAPCDDGPRPPSDPSAGGGPQTMGLPPSGNGSGID
jgi:uncharacterized membrane protein YgcG